MAWDSHCWQNLSQGVNVAGSCDKLDIATMKALAQQLASWLRVPTPGCSASIHDPAGVHAHAEHAYNAALPSCQSNRAQDVKNGRA